MLPNFHPDTVAHGIQLAVAPVFLLTAIAGMIGAGAGRLARIIDRARQLEARLESMDPMAVPHRIYAELGDLRRRGWLMNACIGLLTLSAIFIGVTILALFLVETTSLELLRSATACFFLAVLSFLAALVCFLVETFLATRLLRFSQGPNP